MYVCMQNIYATLVSLEQKSNRCVAFNNNNNNKNGTKQWIAKLIQFIPVQTVRCIVLLKCEKTGHHSLSLNIIKENPILHIDSISCHKKTHRHFSNNTFINWQSKFVYALHIGLCECSYNKPWLKKIHTQKFINIYVRAYVHHFQIQSCMPYVIAVSMVLAQKNLFKILN